MNTKLALILSACMVFGLTACDKKPAPKAPTKPAENKTPAKPDKAPEKPKETVKKDPPKPPAKPLEQKQVKAVVDTWLAAQNSGNFDQYSGTYATRMTGIKRIGPRTYKYNRAGWVKDRKRMFKKKMKVAINDLKIHATPQSAVVSFTQTWESGSYKDVGPKQLLVVKDGKTLRIAREEMITSKIKNASKAKALPHKQFAFAQSYKKGGVGIVLEHKSKLKAKGKVQGDSPHSIVYRDVASIPAETKKLMGKSYAFYGRKGQLCTGTIDGFKLTKDVTLHFSMGQTWEDEKTPMQERLDTTWSYGGAEGTRPSLIATLKTKGDCTGALFARPEGQPKPTYFPQNAKALGTGLAKSVTKALTQSPQFKAVTKEFKDAGMSAQWWDKDLKEMMVFSNPNDKNKAIVYFEKHHICDNPEVHLWQVWEAAKNGDKITLTNVAPKKVSIFLPEDVIAVDLNGDKIPELVSNGSVFQQVGTTYQRIDQKMSYYFDCPC